MMELDTTMTLVAEEHPQAEALMTAGVLELDELDLLIADIELRRKFDEDPTDDDVEDDLIGDDDDDDDDDDDLFGEDEDFEDDDDDLDEDELEIDEDDEDA